MQGSLNRWLFVGMLLLGVGAGAEGAAPVVPDPDVALLKKLGIATDVKALLAFLRERTPDDRDLSRIDKLIEQLGDDELDRREDASARLVRLGGRAEAALKKAAKHKDLEIRRRAAACLKKVEEQMPARSVLAALRVLTREGEAAITKPLLAYLPAADEWEQEAIYLALQKASERELPKALVEALSDRLWQRRAVAGLLVVLLGDRNQRAAARKLLRDEQAEVRLRTAQGLLARREFDPDALVVLVELLRQPSVELAWQAEELLRWAAGESAPDGVVGMAGEKEREACRAAWAAWLKAHGAKVDPKAVRPSRPGLVLFLLRDEKDEKSGRLHLYGCDGLPRHALPCPIPLPESPNWFTWAQVDVIELRSPTGLKNAKAVGMRFEGREVSERFPPLMKEGSDDDKRPRELKLVVGLEGAEVFLQGRRAMCDGVFTWREQDFRAGVTWEVLELPRCGRTFGVWKAWAVCPLVRVGFTGRGRPALPIDRPEVRLAQLASKHPAVRRKGMTRLLEMPATERSWEAAVGAMKDPDPAMRLDAARLAVRYEPKAKQSVPHLLRLLDDTERIPFQKEWRVEVREDVARRYLPQLGADAYPLLLAAAEDRSHTDRIRAGCGVALADRMDGKDKRVVLAVRWALVHSNGELRAGLCWSLTQDLETNGKRTRIPRPGAEACLPELWEAMKDPHRATSSAAGYAIATFADKAVEMKPKLIKALARRETRTGAAKALGELFPKDPEVIKAAAAQLRDAPGDRDGVSDVLTLLHNAGVAAEPAIPALLDCIEQKQNMKPPRGHNISIAEAALEVLKGLGPKAKPAVARLRKLHQNETTPPELRKYVGYALDKIEPKTKDKK